MLNNIVPRNVFQQVAIGAAHAESAVVAVNTKKLCLVSTVDCYIDIGTAPVATSAKWFLPAKTPMFFVVQTAGNEKVSCLQVGAGGTLFISEGSNL